MTPSRTLLRGALPLWLALGALPPAAVAQTAAGMPGAAAADPTAQPLSFRRIFAPADRIGRDWATGNTPYWPIEASEFERLIKLAHEAGTVSELGSAQLVSAHYEARLIDDELLSGKFTWEITHGAAEAALLSLEPCNLPLENVRWEHGEPAILGNGPDGQLGLLVEHAGKLHGTWSIRGQRSAAGSVSFGLSLPAAVCIRLTCELPKGMTAAADHGVVMNAGGAAGGFQRWVAELGGHSRVRFRALAEGAATENRQLTLLSQAMDYEFTKRGVDVAGRLRLDVHNEPLERLYVRLDPGLKLLAARYGEVDVPWTIVPEPPVPQPAAARPATRPADKAADKGGAEKRAADKPPPTKPAPPKPVPKGTRIALDFPEPLLGTGHVLRLTAQAPLPLGERLRLPGMQAEGVFWQEGVANLSIPNPLVLEQIAVHGARQSKTAPLAMPAGGESIELQYFGADATIDIVVDQPDQRFQVDCGTIVDLAAAEVTAQMTARMQLSQGERFVVRADVGSQWLVDSVESDTDIVSDWTLVTAQDKSRQLVIRLKHAVTPRRPAVLYLKGHRATTLGEKIAGGNLPMVRFSGQNGTQLLAVRAPESYDLQLLNADELNRRDPSRLGTQELALFSEEPTGLVFAVDASLARLSLSLAARKPSYAGEVAIDAAAHGKSLHETYTIRCTPQGSRVERLLVNFSHGAKQSLHWTLVGGNAGQLAARRLGDNQGPTHVPGGESWEIALRLPRPGPFEIRATRTVPLTNNLPVALVSLPEATAQQGTVTIRAVAETGLVVNNRRLQPVPADLLPPDKYQTVRATFRYEPSRDALAEPAVTLSPAASWQETAGAWAWSTTLDSRYGLTGTANHVATYQLQTVGRQSVHCSLPSTATPRGVWVDERQISLAALGDMKQGIRLDLPPGRSFVTLVVHFTTDDALPSLVRTARPPVPSLDVPELERHWLLWLPPGYELFDADPRWLVQPVQQITWTQRLFGPLGRHAREQVFNPLVAEQWREISTALHASSGRESEFQRLQAALAALGAEERQAAQRTGLVRRSSWGTLLGRWKAADSMAGLKLLVDVAALSRLGFDADTPLPAIGGEDDLVRGMSLLTQGNLMLLAHGDAVVISTAAAAARRREHLIAAESNLAWALADGPLAMTISAAAAGNSVQFINLDSWLAGGATYRLPWTLPTVARDDLAGTCGWNAAWLELPGDTPPMVRLVRTAGLQALGWALCLAILAIGACWSAQRATPWIIAAGGLAAIALVAPAAWTLVLAPTLLAVLIYLVLMAIGKLYLLAWPIVLPEKSAPAVLQPQVLTILAFAAALAATGMRAWADEPPGNAAAANAPAVGAQVAAASQSPPFIVYIPIDDDQKPTGGKYYVPEEMLKQLQRIATAAQNHPTGWMITEAVYRGSITRDTLQRRLSVSELKGVFELRVFEPNVQIRIPLDRDAVPAAGDPVRLDGRPVKPEWDAVTGTLLVPVTEQGQYRLEINLQPGSQSMAAHGGFDLAIPALSRSAVELSVPMDAPVVDLPSARGTVAVSRDRTTLVGQLGPTTRLAVRWPDAGGADGTGTNLETEELTWVDVRPGSLTLDARLRFRVLEGRVRQIRLLADGRLRLLPADGKDDLVAEIHSFPGEPQIIDVEFSRPVAEQATLDLKFMLAGSSGAGNLRLPRLEVSGARAARRWMALSVDPLLQFKEQPGGDARLLPAGEFAGAWPSRTRPTAAYSVPRGELPLAIVTEPRETRTTVDQVLTMAVGEGQLGVRWDVVLQTTSGSNYELSLDGPANLHVESVTLFEDAAQHVTRWSQDNAGRITVFLDGPLSGTQQLTLAGTIPVAVTSRVALPRLSVQAAEARKLQVNVYRSPAVLVELEDLHDLAPPAGDAQPAPRPDLGSPVAALTARGPDPGGFLKLRPNSPETEGVLAVTLQRENDAWVAEADFLLRVADGLVDTIRLDVPLQWNEPYQLEPPLAHEVFTIPGESRRQLLIRPATPIKDHLRVRVRGRLGLAGGERMRVPDISAAWVGKLERFVVLPAQLELQQVEWETVGLRSAPLPEDFQKPLPAPETFTSYQVVGDRFQAALKSVERMSGVPQVRLADIHVAWRADGSCHGTAAFDVEPAGSKTCLLYVPSQLSLVHAAVTGLPAIMEPAGQDRWQVSLGSSELPQHIEVLFRGQMADNGWTDGDWRFEAPSIIDLEVERTLWTVYAPPQAGAADARSAQNRATPAQLELWRTKNVALMLNLASDAAADQLPEDIVRWYRPWQGRFERSRAIIRADYLAAAAGRPDREENEAQALEQEQAGVVRRLGMLGSAKPRAAIGYCHQPSEILPAEHIGERTTLCTFRGSAGQKGPARLDLQYAETWTGDLSRRILAALALLFVGLAGGWLAERASWPTISPASAAMIVGLAWWLACHPSLLGLAVFAGGALAKGRQWWRQRNQE